jgi:hypothetical protein
VKAISLLNPTSKKRAAITAYIVRAQCRFPERIRSVVLFGSQVDDQRLAVANEIRIMGQAWRNDPFE